MGLVLFAFAGVGFILIGTHEAINQSKKRPSALFFISLVTFSSFFIINSAVSLLDAHNSNDAVGTALQLQVLSIALIFLFYSVLPLLQTLPSALVGLVAAFALAEEFLLFYLQRKDSNGVENRYYDLLLVPIAICIFCTLLQLKSPHSNIPKLGRGLGLILQGTWFIQIGFSLFSGWVAQGCSLHRASRGNYTLRCKGHPEYHRAKAIATLQFNCHLALFVLLLVAFFSFFSPTNGVPLDHTTRYAPLGAELQSFQDSANFTLDSDDGDDEEQIHHASDATQKAIVVQHAANANGNVNASHH
ncbi:uncharacterized protein LOC113847737 [Abrus precatorius]|uniref:Uncharacterized protein LOC113847737 n=1 Tax=Abrus precatorius TaxID=3816 RepID=A0A8B8JMV4_ABRPR|nr:uncharacterized protein LOC113847737 [Abrus precatorius]